MTLSTHIVTGATAAALCTTNPVAGFFIGMATHYALDMIPHWDYPIKSFEITPGEDAFSLNKKVRFSKRTLSDIAWVVGDALLGFTVLWVVVGLHEQIALMVDAQLVGLLRLLFAGAIGGAMPDFLQFLYGVFKVWPLRKLQEFHNIFHAKIKLDDRPLIGVPIQLGIIVLSAFVLFFTNF